MANRYWVGGTANWDATAGTKWALTNGGAGGQAVPTASDDVFFASSSTGTCTINAASVCRSLTCTGFTGTITGTAALNVGTTTAGNIVLVSGMTWSYTGTLSKVSTGACSLTTAGKTITALTLSGNSTLTLQDTLNVGTLTTTTGTLALNAKDVNVSSNISIASGTTVSGASGTLTFTSTSTGKTITTNGKTLGNITFNGVGGGWTLQDNLVSSGGNGAITLTAGALNTNGKTVTCKTFYGSGTLTRSLTLGATGWTCSDIDGNNFSWDITDPTNMTLTANTSTLTFTKALGCGFASGGLTYNNVTFNSSICAPSISGAATFATLTINNCYSSSIANSITCTNLTVTTQTAVPNVGILSSQGNITVSGTASISGNSTNRLLLGNTGMVNSATSPITLTVNTTLTTAYIDLIGVTGAGSASRNLSAITGNSGDAGNNSNFTFTSPSTAYWFQNSGDFSDSSKWFLATGGAGGAARVPLPQDTAIFDANSFSFTGEVITFNIIFRTCYTLDFSASTNAPELATTFGIYLQGDAKFNSGVILPANGINFYGQTASILYSNGVNWSFQSSPTGVIKNGGGTFAISANDTLFYLQQSAGTVNIGAFNLTVTQVYQLAGTINMGSGAWNAGVLQIAGTVNQQTAALTVYGLYDGTGANHYTTVDMPSDGGGLTGIMTIDTINLYADNTYTFGTGSIITIGTNIVAVGSSGHLITMASDNPGVGTYTFTKASGTIGCDYLSLGDSIATGGAAWYAGSHSTNNGNNTGWIFTDPPPPSSVATFTAQASLAAAGRSLISRSATFSPHAALAAVGASTVRAVATMAAHGTMTAAGRSTFSAVATFAASASLSARSFSGSGTATFTSSASLVAVGRAGKAAVATMAASASLAAVGASTHRSHATISPSASLAAVGAGRHNSQLVIMAAASLAAVGRAFFSSSAIITAHATLAAAGNARISRAATFSPSASLAAQGATNFAVVANFTPSASMSAAGRSTARAAATFSPHASLGAVGAAFARSVATISADTDMNATGQAFAFRTVFFNAQAVMSTTGRSTARGVATFNPSASLLAPGIAFAIGTATFTASASLIAHAVRITKTPRDRIMYPPEADRMLTARAVGVTLFGPYNDFIL